MAVDDININVKVSGTEQLKALSHAMRQLNAGMVDSSKSVANLDARAKSLSTALGRTDKGMSDHAKTVGQLLTNQRALGGEMRNVNKDIGQLTTGLAVNGKNAKENAASLRVYNESLKGIKARAFKEDLAGVTQEMRRLGKDAQFTGRAMTVGLTVPLLAFSRLGLQSVVAVDKQLTRLNKILENTARNTSQAFDKMGLAAESATAPQKIKAEEMVAAYKALDTGLTAISQKYGTSRDLVIGLAGDFAELGLIANNSSVVLAELTVQAEKLGDLNITGAKDLVQTMYQNATTSLIANADARGIVLDGLEKEKSAIDIAYTQLAAFNQIENVTALSLKDIAKALPEVAATATAFGISMTEVTAILAPMKSAGFDVGASATAIKVSLQRLNAPTGKTKDMMAQLAQVTGYDFPEASGIGINSLDRLARAFSFLSHTARNAQGELYGTEGALEFFSQMFGVRQSTRMEVAIRDMASFNTALAMAGTQEGKLAASVNSTILSVNKATNANVPLIKGFSDLGNIARISAGQVGDSVQLLDGQGKEFSKVISQADINLATNVRNQTADMIIKSRREGDDLLAKISTQSGKSLLVEFAGGKANVDLAKIELKQATGTIDASIQRVKNNFKLIAASIIENLRPVLEFLDRFATGVASFFNKLSAPARTAIVAFLGFVAILGPLKMGLGAVQVAFATIAGSFLKFIPGLSGLTAEAVSASGQLMYLNAPLVAINGNIETTASKFSILTAKLASGDGVISSVAKKFGLFTGVLQANVTAQAEVVTAVEEVTFVLGKQQATLAKSSALMSLQASEKTAHQAKTDSIIADINRRIAADSGLLSNTLNTSALQETAFRQYGATYGLTSKEIEAAILVNNASINNNASVSAKASASKIAHQQKSMLQSIAAYDAEQKALFKMEATQARIAAQQANRDLLSAERDLKRLANKAAKAAEASAAAEVNLAIETQVDADRQIAAQITADKIAADAAAELAAVAAAEEAKRAEWLLSALARKAVLEEEMLLLADVEAARLATMAPVAPVNPQITRPRIPKGQPGAGQFMPGQFSDLGKQGNIDMANAVDAKKQELLNNRLDEFIIKQDQLIAINPMVADSLQILEDQIAIVSAVTADSTLTISEHIFGALEPQVVAINNVSAATVNSTALIAAQTAVTDADTAATEANAVMNAKLAEVQALKANLASAQTASNAASGKSVNVLNNALITENTLLDELTAAIKVSTLYVDGNGNAVGGAAAAYKAWEQTVLASADMSLVYKLSLQNVNSTLTEQIALIMADAEAVDFLSATQIKNSLASTQAVVVADALTLAKNKQAVANAALAASEKEQFKVGLLRNRSLVNRVLIDAPVRMKTKIVEGVSNRVSNRVEKIVGQSSLTDLKTKATNANTLAEKLNVEAIKTKMAFDLEMEGILATNTSLTSALAEAKKLESAAIMAVTRATTAEMLAKEAFTDLMFKEAVLTNAGINSKNADVVASVKSAAASELRAELLALENAGLADTAIANAVKTASVQADTVATTAAEVAAVAKNELTIAQTAYTEANTLALALNTEAAVFLQRSEDSLALSMLSTTTATDLETKAIAANVTATQLKTDMDLAAARAANALTASTTASAQALSRQTAVTAGASARGSGFLGVRGAVTGLPGKIKTGFANNIIGQTKVRGVTAVKGVAAVAADAAAGTEAVKGVAGVKGVDAVKGRGIKGLIGSKAIKAVAGDAATGAEGIAASAGTGIKGMAGKIGGLVKSFMSLGGMLKMVKLLLIGTFAVAAIVVVVGIVAMLVSGFKKFGSAMTPIKEGMEALKQAFFAIVAPIKDAIATLLGFGGDGKGSKSPQSQMRNIAETIKKVAVAVSDFVTKHVVPIIEKVMNAVINIIGGIVKIVKGFINIFKGDWKKGLGQVLEGVATIFKAILKVVKLGIDLWFKLNEKLVSVLVKSFFGLAKAIVQAIGGAFEWVFNKFADITDALVGWIPGLSGLAKAIRGIGKSVSDTLDTFGKTLDGWGDKAAKAASGIYALGRKTVDSLFNAGDKLISTISGKWVDTIKGAGEAMTGGAKKEAPKIAEIYTDAAGSGLDEAAEKAGFKVRDLKQRFVDAALGLIAESIRDAVDQMAKALEKQKSAALAVYDAQLETINKLEKAEQSLTQEMQYQSDRRRMIAERALQVENYQRNRALAIYEGRIDDARVLSLEDSANKISFTENVTKLDTDRQKSLAAENLAALRDNIAKAKEETAKFFDETIQNFRDAAAEITKFPPLTVEEYGNQLDALNEVATAAADKNGETFKEMMGELVTHLSEDLPNQGVPVFTTALDSLVSVAIEKYGLGKGAGDDTIIGATIGMLMGMTGQITENSSSIVAAFGSIIGDIQGTAALGLDILTSGIVQPALDALTMVMVTHNPFEVFAIACTNANLQLLYDTKKVYGAIGSVVDGLGNHLDDLLVKLGLANFLQDQLADAPPPPPPVDPLTLDWSQLSGFAGGYGNNGGSRDFETPKKPLGKYGSSNPYTNGTKGIGGMPVYYGPPVPVYYGPPAPGAFNGGYIRKFAYGGFNVPGAESQGIKALLHGGEFVINAAAVRNIGMATLTGLNNMRFQKPVDSSNYNVSGGTNSTSTVNIIVDNFIGEDQWFNELIKKYNMNVVPRNQKSAGLEGRVLTSYSGLSRGM